MRNNRPVFHKYTINTDPRAEAWLDGKPGTDDEWARGYLLHHKRSVEELIFWEDNAAWMRRYLAVRKADIERSIACGVGRRYAFLDAVDRLILRAVGENCMQLRAWLVEYKSRTFDDAFIDEADADRIDLEFELRDPLPAERHAPGSRIVMGRCRTGVDGREEAIEWQVLDLIGDRALLVSCNVLDVQPLHHAWGRMTWENCSLRTWMNETFLRETFTEAERGRVIRARISNPDNYLYGTDAGPDTEDRVFLLSMEQAREYFTCDAERIAFATPYAEAKAAPAGQAPPEAETALPWRLRTPGYKGGCFNSFVRADGMIDLYGCFNEQHGFGIRPAMWIRL